MFSGCEGSKKKKKEKNVRFSIESGCLGSEDGNMIIEEEERKRKLEAYRTNPP
jgi:hypothetical protein